MFPSTRRFVALAAAAVLVAGVLAATSQAYPPTYFHRGAVVLPNSTGLVNPNYQIYPGLSINQYAYNLSVLGRAYRNVPPYALGYNPYGTVLNYYGASPAYNPYAAYYYNPYAYTYYNPYLYGSGYYPYYGVYNLP